MFGLNLLFDVYNYIDNIMTIISYFNNNMVVRGLSRIYFDRNKQSRESVEKIIKCAQIIDRTPIVMQR